MQIPVRIRLAVVIALGVVVLAVSPAAAIADGPPSVAASFSPAGIPPNGTSTLTMTLTNPSGNTSAAAGVALTDTLPANLVVATPNGLGNTCGGTASATAGSGQVSLTGGTIAANSSCTVTVDVTSSATGTYVNSTGPVSSTNGGTGNSASATLSVASPPTITKLFDNDTVPSGDVVGLSFTITNPNSNSTPPSSDVTLTGAAFTDTLPTGMEVANPSNAFTDCGGLLTATPGSTSISLTGGTVPVQSENNPSGACFVAVEIRVTAAQGLMLSNTSGPVTANESGPGTTSNTATVAVGPAPVGPTLTKGFGAGSIAVGEQTSLTFTISNPNSAIDFISAGFTDTLPAGLTVASPNNAGGTCVTDKGATVTAAPGSAVVTLSSLGLAAATSCTVSVNVAGTAPGAVTNTTTPTATYDNGTGTATPIRGGAATAPITVVGPPVASAAFTPSSIRPGGTSALAFTVRNTNAGAALSGINFTDALPAGVSVATPNGLTGSCGGGTVSAAGGGTSIALANAALPAGQSCTFAVSVVAAGSLDGRVTTATSPVSAAEGGAGGAASASLTIAGPPSITAAFTPPQITTTSPSTLTFTIHNPNANALLTGLTFADSLPTGVVLANPVQVRSDCEGQVDAAAGAGRIAFTGGSLAPGRSCAVSVQVAGRTTGQKSTTSSAVNSTEGGAGNTATASVTVTLPSNNFTVTRIRPQGNGNVIVDLSVPGPGVVDLLVTAWNDNFAKGAALLQPARHRFVFSRAHAVALRAGALRVTAKPSARGRQLLRHPRYRVVVRVWVTFTPTGGITRTRGASGLHFAP